MYKKLRQLLLLFVMFFSFPLESKAAVIYPLQSKYPDIMLYKAETDQKIIALTFDDGPDERFTPRVLDVLKKHNVKATFFLLGTRVEKYQEVAKRILNEGHIIGNHTYWHPDLSKGDTNHLVWEIEKTEAAIKSVLDINTKLFRAPYGALNESHVERLGELGFKGIGWSIDSEDWKSLSKEKINENVINAIHPGAIVLMHSAGHWTQDLTGTVEALDELIVYLKEQDYTIVTVPDLMGEVYK